MVLTLVFNTTEKTVKVYVGLGEKEEYEKYTNIPTVKVREEGIYEILQTGDDNRVYPVARFPVASTVMYVRK